MNKSLKNILAGAAFVSAGITTANAGVIKSSDFENGLMNTTESCNLGYMSDDAFGTFCSNYNADTNILSTWADTSKSDTNQLGNILIYENEGFFDGSSATAGVGDKFDFTVFPGVGNIYGLLNNDRNDFSSLDINLLEDLKKGDSFNFNFIFSDKLSGYTSDKFQTVGTYTPKDSVAVPEPSTILMFGSALAGFAYSRKKKLDLESKI